MLVIYFCFKWEMFVQNLINLYWKQTLQILRKQGLFEQLSNVLPPWSDMHPVDYFDQFCRHPW